MATFAVTLDNGSVITFEGNLTGNITSPGAATVRGPYSFAFNTPSLNAGVAFYTPNAGDLLLDVFVIVDTGFDGTTPQFDFGRTGDQFGIFDNCRSAIDVSGSTIATTETTGVRNLLLYGSMGGLYWSNHTQGGGADGPIQLIDTAAPFTAWVSQDGQQGGAAVGGTAGAARLYLVTATPSAF